MKKILIFNIFLFLIPYKISAQWIPQNSVINNARFYDVFFINENTGWIVGSGQYNKAAILKTTNSGVTWSYMEIDTINNIQSVWFIDSLTGWACGNSGTILKTINGGDNWVVQTSGVENTIFNIQFIDENNGWASCLECVLKTTDSGWNWMTYSTGISDRSINASYFSDSTTGWIGMGYYGKPALILKTTDGGMNWISQSNPLESIVTDIFFINNEIGWCVDVYGHIAKTTNGGKDWFMQCTREEYPQAIYFVNSDTGWAAGGNNIIFSANGGGTWISQNSNTTNSMYDIYFVNSQLGWVVGNNSTILKYDNINPVLAVRSPNGGENYLGGRSVYISWYYLNVNNVKIEYTINNGTDWIVIADSYPADELSYVWEVPNTPSAECKIKIGDVDHPTVSDESNYVFHITYSTPVIRVEYPDGGEYLTKGRNYDIKWYEENVSIIDIEYTLDNGDTWISIVKSYPADSNAYCWTLPDTISSRCKVKITDGNQPSIFDESNNTFSIVEWDVDKIKILNPNGGECYPARTHQKIFFNKYSIYYYNVYISYNNGHDWKKINWWDEGSWEWVVPDTISDSCLFKIVHQTDSTEFDISDSVFSIVDGPIPIILNFPLQVDNKWFFSHDYEYPVLTVLEITKDTLMSDGFNYAKIDRYDFTDMIWDTTEYKYLRQEENIIYVYPNDTLLNSDWTYEGLDTTIYPYYADVEFQYSLIFDTYKPTWFRYVAYPVEYCSFSQDFGFNALRVITWRDWMQKTRILRGCILDGQIFGYTTVSGIDIKEIQPNKFTLNQNYPNPFNPSTRISYSIPNSGIIILKVYNILGGEIQTLVNAFQEAGTYSVNFDASKLSSGIYFYRLQVGSDFIETRKMLLMR